MRARSILTLLVAMTLTACVVEGDDDDDDGVSDGTDDGTDDGADDGSDGSDGGDDGSDGADDGSDGADDGSDDGGTAVEPRTGAWDYSEYQPSVNDCDIPDDYGNGGGGFGLINDGGGTFRVLPNDSTDPFDCNLDGADFDCPDRATEEAVIDPGLDALLVGQATAEGTFSDPENASGSQTAIVDCQGADCAAVEAATGADFPCTFTVNFVIDWRADG
jgi:hypothetical protein